jgi:hypothetical protein
MGVLSHYNKRLFMIQIGGDDAIKISELISQEYSGEAYNKISSILTSNSLRKHHVHPFSLVTEALEASY